MNPKPLDPFDAPLEGMNLIEAAAGTGKTWTIIALYLRLLLEQELSVRNILVVTYTRAATRELHQRIRKSLGQALSSFESGECFEDPLLKELEVEKGRIVVQKDQATSVPGIFAGGDCVEGPDLTVQAVQDGKVAAEAIDRYVSIAQKN